MKKLLLLLCLTAVHAEGFQSLSNAQRYAQSVPEFPENDADTLEFANYNSFYDSLKPSWWKRMLQTLRLAQRPAWRPSDFQPLLLKARSITLPSELSVSQGTQIITFGSLYGAFHSLVRGLSDLQARGIIKNNFKLKEDTFVIFLGNAIDFSAYSLETLSIILQLMTTNKDRVFYLAGPHELKKTWHGYGLKKELDQRLSRQAAQLTKELNEFFRGLPTQLAVSLQNSDESLVLAPKEPKKNYRIIITGDDNLASYEEGDGLYKQLYPEQTLWQVVSSPVAFFRKRHRFFYDAYVDIAISNTLNASTISLRYSTGTTPFTQGSTYNLLSGSLLKRGILRPAITTAKPMKLSQEQLAEEIETVSTLVDRLNTHVELIEKQLPKTALEEVPSAQTELLAKLSSSTPLTQEELQSVAFEVEQLYNELAKNVDFLALQAEEKGLESRLAPPVADDTITLGSSLDVSKSVKGLGIPFRSGMALRVNKQNQEGGIKGKRVEIVFLDDGYIPAISRQNILTLLNKYKTPYILAPIGSPTLLASLDLIKEKKILALFPQSGSPAFRKTNLEHIINMRASFTDEGKLLTEYVLDTHFPKNFVFFYQDDEFGTSILKGAQEALENADVQATKVSYLANTTYFKDAAEKIKEANPDAIGFFATGPATLQLIRDLGVEFFANKVLYAVSSVADEATVKVLKDKGLNVIFGQVVPDPKTSTLPIVKEYKEELKKQGLEDNIFSLESYITTSLTFDALSKIPEPLTMRKLIAYFEGLKDYTYKGLLLNFNPKTRSLAHHLWINTGQGPWIEKVVREDTHEKN